MNLARTFDAIIVGAGPAGCVLANRLSEERDQVILLLEAGPDAAAPGSEHPDLLDPFCGPASDNQAFQWPSAAAEARALHDDPAYAPQSFVQGHGVGGSSNINGMGADRGLPADYDAWRDLGAEQWSWGEVLPYFKKLEHDLDFPLATEHGDSGPMPVRRLPRSRWAPFATAVAKALQHRGFPFIDDYMSDFRDGFAAVPTNCLPDRRMSAAMAYLTREVRQRSNLTVLADTMAERLVFEGRRATGVLISRDGVCSQVRGRQVILSGGAIQTPSLLMRSGIGPARLLSRHGIGVVHDLRGVGSNLQNHPSIALTAYLRAAAAQPPGNPWLLQSWLRFSSHEPDCEPSDMHLMAFNRCAWHALGPRTGALVVSVLKPYSKGSVELASADPLEAPRVRFNSLADPRDHERLVNGLRFAAALMADPAVARVRHDLLVPDAGLIASLRRRSAWNGFRSRAIVAMLAPVMLRRHLLSPFRVDEGKLLANRAALLQFVASQARVQYHLCGTCRMGRPDDPDAVVDGAGQVLGVRGLRAVDASIFPTIPRGYPHFIVLMVAEKIADVVKAARRR